MFCERRLRLLLFPACYPKAPSNDVQQRIFEWGSCQRTHAVLGFLFCRIQKGCHLVPWKSDVKHGRCPGKRPVRSRPRGGNEYPPWGIGKCLSAQTDITDHFSVARMVHQAYDEVIHRGKVQAGSRAVTGQSQHRPRTGSKAEFDGRNRQVARLEVICEALDRCGHDVPTPAGNATSAPDTKRTGGKTLNTSQTIGFSQFPAIKAIS